MIPLGDIGEVKITHKDKAVNLEIFINSLTKYSEQIQQKTPWCIWDIICKTAFISNITVLIFHRHYRLQENICSSDFIRFLDENKCESPFPRKVRFS